MFPAAKALVKSFGRGDRKTRGFLFVKRAVTLVVIALWGQFYIFTDNIGREVTS